ncbi:terminase small subunit [Microbacterium phage Coltrane]|uniref:Terminase small subunit n=6 Tax=Armstrongvirus armstrong TaxID=2734217 RepID=A0A3G2KD30_9CAUD|nr:terminase small subunit [Microbacterium phage Armstrong]AYN55874.1 terminase small subunit [Microbacterium phage Brahms]AYN56980.1 terminase small subunit [Microbacterium phage Bernstein]AYN57339.1 terminase small subunit [Microbacterium phage Coltrane]AYN58927.1 terminase small subunit [Microbacterium phage Rollins]QED11424.1 terminase small subunit [Microbacterium phage Vitas]UGL61968.1 terminase small subunit [Microbacterium phage Skylord]UOK18154.1 terminase small subunit [Microbacter
MSTLREAFDKAVEDNPHALDVDGALIAAGQTMASAIDSITADPEATATEKTKALYLTPHLVSILKELLATPAARQQFNIATGDAKKASRLALIKGQAKSPKE